MKLKEISSKTEDIQVESKLVETSETRLRAEEEQQELKKAMPATVATPAPEEDDADIDGEPMDSDIDGEPLDSDIDGEPMDVD